MGKLDDYISGAAKDAQQRMLSLYVAVQKKYPSDTERQKLKAEQSPEGLEKILDFLHSLRESMLRLLDREVEQHFEQVSEEERISAVLDEVDEDSDTGVIQREEGVWDRIRDKLNIEEPVQKWMHGPFADFTKVGHTKEVLARAKEYATSQCRKLYLMKLRRKVRQKRGKKKKETTD